MVPIVVAVVCFGAAVAEEASGPKKGDTVYLAGAWTRAVSESRVSKEGAPPNDRIKCDETRDCQWESRACDPFVLRSQTEDRTVVRTGDGGLFPLLWRLDGDYRSLTYTDRAACLSYVESWCAEESKDDKERQARHFICEQRPPVN
jgi:hypothetical protein